MPRHEHDNGEEFKVNQTEEQARSPGIDDWIEAKRSGGGNPEEDSESSNLFILID